MNEEERVGTCISYSYSAKRCPLDCMGIEKPLSHSRHRFQDIRRWIDWAQFSKTGPENEFSSPSLLKVKIFESCKVVNMKVVTNWILFKTKKESTNLDLRFRRYGQNTEGMSIWKINPNRKWPCFKVVFSTSTFRIS